MSDLIAAQRAYALLWRSPVADPLVHAARHDLRDDLSPDERRAAVKWVLGTAGEMTTGELIAADIRAGVFPERSDQ